MNGQGVVPRFLPDGPPQVEPSFTIALRNLLRPAFGGLVAVGEDVATLFADDQTQTLELVIVDEGGESSRTPIGGRLRAGPLTAEGDGLIVPTVPSDPRTFPSVPGGTPFQMHLLTPKTGVRSFPFGRECWSEFRGNATLPQGIHMVRLEVLHGVGFALGLLILPPPHRNRTEVFNQDGARLWSVEERLVGVVDGMVILARAGSVLARDSEGAVVWTRALQNWDHLVVEHGALLLTSDPHPADRTTTTALTRLDARTGREAWRHTKGVTVFLAGVFPGVAVISVGGGIAVRQAEGGVRFIDLLTGETRLHGSLNRIVALDSSRALVMGKWDSFLECRPLSSLSEMIWTAPCGHIPSRYGDRLPVFIADERGYFLRDQARLRFFRWGL